MIYIHSLFLFVPSPLFSSPLLSFRFLSFFFSFLFFPSSLSLSLLPHISQSFIWRSKKNKNTDGADVKSSNKCLLSLAKGQENGSLLRRTI